MTMVFIIFIIIIIIIIIAFLEVHMSTWGRLCFPQAAGCK